MVSDGTKALPGGVLAAMVTPVDESGTLDEAALDRLIAEMLAEGIAGISPAGSTGEGPRLSRAERLRMVDAVRKRTPPHTPVVPGVPVTTTAETATELYDLSKLGATAALVAAPSYYPASEADVERLYQQLADDSPIPLVLYNIPAMTKVAVSPAVIGTLARHPQIVGIKDSSRDLEYLQAVLYAVSDANFNVFTGNDTLLLASLLLGADGAIVASANLVPRLPVSLYSAIRNGDLQTARELQEHLFNVVQACRRGIAPAGWKAALEVAGICSARLITPASRLPDELYQALSADLARLLPGLGS